MKLSRWFRKESGFSEVGRTVAEGVGTARWFGSLSLKCKGTSLRVKGLLLVLKEVFRG